MTNSENPDVINPGDSKALESWELLTRQVPYKHLYPCILAGEDTNLNVRVISATPGEAFLTGRRFRNSGVVTQEVREGYVAISIEDKLKEETPADSSYAAFALTRRSHEFYDHVRQHMKELQRSSTPPQRA